MKEIKQIDQNTIKQFIDYLIERKSSPVALKNELGIEDFNNSAGTIFLKPNSLLFTRIELHFSNDDLVSATFFGEFNLSFNALIELFGKCRSVYVPYDDHFEYFFNEDKLHGDFVVKTFSKNEFDKIHNWEVKNIQIRW